ncbi:hypothetical protein QWI17_04025 [Gilvimarinus sp. SDUM040013]|uniref:Uncharacterized protein n=1 Tax=Gilvimarinus gilvus TaxID=3058038 RepID=A0ABU4RU23_9GAMM|nr:hypothetical protein [Gilvimarinus sp. SDUM040013]MDO3385005.1 hypothetical protein [Gilvimarinus sp. SDUM040013]MDX6848380.1 hypothetical protein [Gilvimarinus sp. SDUM040013]
MPNKQQRTVKPVTQIAAQTRASVASRCAGRENSINIMPKLQKQLTPAQQKTRKKAKIERQKKYMWVFMNGMQVRVKRPSMIGGIRQDEWIVQSADPIWVHQNEMWEVLNSRGTEDEECPF